MFGAGIDFDVAEGAISVVGSWASVGAVLGSFLGKKFDYLFVGFIQFFF
jgi:hypothetical protein